VRIADPRIKRSAKFLAWDQTLLYSIPLLREKQRKRDRERGENKEKGEGRNG